MRKQTLFLTLAMVVLTFFACKPPKEFLEKLDVTPSPLEMHANQVEVEIEGTFPEKYLPKKMIMTVTPVLKFKDGKMVKGEPKVYQGEKVKGNDDKVSYKNGGKYSQTAKFTYEPGMEQSELMLDVVIKDGDKSYTLDMTKIADGVNITPLMVSTQPGTGDLQAVVAPDKFQRIIEEKEDAEIMFLINQSYVRNNEMKSEDVVDLTKAIKAAKEAENREIKGLSISSYASPDGEMEMNEKLSDRRSKASQKYIENQIRRMKAEVSIDSKFTAEDWDGFRQLIEASSIEDKAVILRVLSMYSDPAQREDEIKKLSVAYKTIAENILPQLRRSKMTLTVNVIGKSDEEISKLVKEDSKQLNIEEILYAATLVNNLDEKHAIYTKATEMFPTCYRAINNLGMIYYEQGNIDAAARCFTKALELNAKEPVVNYNNGLIALSKGDMAKAEEFFGNAGGVGNGLNIANAVLAIHKGQYKKAADLLKDSKSNNAVLANILNKNNTAARDIAKAIDAKNATTHYLNAIICARTNDAKGLVANLKSAIEMNGEMKAKAAGDVEFISFRENTEFASLVK